MIQSGRIPKDESIVVSITGNGLKTLEVVADDLPYPMVIDPKLSEFDQLLEQQTAEKAGKSSPSRERELAAAAS